MAFIAADIGGTSGFTLFVVLLLGIPYAISVVRRARKKPDDPGTHESPPPSPDTSGRTRVGKVKR